VPGDHDAVAHRADDVGDDLQNGGRARPRHGRAEREHVSARAIEDVDAQSFRRDLEQKVAGEVAQRR
jgi:hypothetical protein